MALTTGYNLVRAAAARRFSDDYQRKYGVVAESLSVIAFLRLVRHQQQPPHRHLLVTGFEHLWTACDDAADLQARLKQQLFTPCANWLQNNLAGVYFKLPSDVDFVHGRTIQLAMGPRQLVDLDVLLGGMPEQVDTDHYRRPFTMS